MHALPLLCVSLLDLPDHPCASSPNACPVTHLLTAPQFASGESAGAKCITSDDGQSDRWLEASMEQLCVPLPPWALRAGARETIWFNPAEVNAASEWGVLGEGGGGAICG